MFFFLSTNEFTITQDKRKETLFTIEFKERSKELIQSIVKSKLLIGTTISDDDKFIQFSALSIKTLEQHQKTLFKNQGTKKGSYQITLKMLYDLSNQLSMLEKNSNKVFYCYEPEKIIVIDQCIFIYLSNENMISINDNEKNNIVFTSPFHKTNGFLCPEIKAIKSIPTEINARSTYYSLGALAIYMLTAVDITNTTTTKTTTTKTTTTNTTTTKPIITEIINQIKETKLFYMLERCLNEKAEDRSILFI